MLRDPSAADAGKWAVVEVQRRIDAAKARRWPLAMALMGDRYGVDGELVVITASSRVASWARGAAVHRSGETRWGVRPTVLHLGPQEAERILAEGAPEMAVFAAWVMQQRRGAQAAAIARRALPHARPVRCR